MKRYNEYKDSGVKWIGEIPGLTKIVLLKRVAHIVLGKMLASQPKSESDSLEYYLCAKDIHYDGIDYSDMKQMYFSKDEKEFLKVRKGNLLVVEGGAGAGGSFVVDEDKDCYIQNSVLKVFPKYDVNTKFVWYNLFNLVKQGYIDYVCNKATIPHFTKEKLGSTPITLPPLLEQEAIVTYLDSKVAKIDEYISIAEKKIAALEELKQTIIADAVTRGIHKDVPMKDSGVKWIGMIPEHWDTPRIKSVAIFNPSKSTVNYQKVGYAPMDCIRCGNITAGIIDYKKLPTGLTYFENEDIVVAKVTPCFENGNIAIAKNLHNGCAYGSSELFVFRCYGVENRYLFYYMQDEKFKHKCCSTMTGTGGLKRISSSFIRNAFIPLPPLPEQQEIVTYLDSKVANINQLCQAERSQIEKLKGYKLRLISDVVTGKVKVTND